MCNHSFSVLPSQNTKRICCSQACGVRYRETKIPTKSCKGCGATFKCATSRKNMVFCSSSCRKTYKNVEVVCVECHKRFSVTRSKYQEKIKNASVFYCSKKCAYKNMPSRGGGYVKNCNACKLDFETYDPKKYTCSTLCSEAWREEKSKTKRTVCVCKNCEKTFDRPNSAIEWSAKRGNRNMFCSNECRVKYSVGARHPVWIHDRSKIKNKDHTFRQSPAAIEWRDSIFIRDGYTCQECFKVGYVEAHHIIPLRVDPSLSLDIKNGITLCRECHIKTFRRELDFAEKYKKMVENKCEK